MKFTPQHDQMDCGPACLSMIASKYGKKYSLQYLRDNSFLTREGVSLLGLTEASKKIGFDTLSAKLTIEKLIDEKQTLPCILHWNQNHFVVLKKITRNIFTKKYYFHLADPAHGLIKLDEIKFKNSWIVDDNKGVSLFLEPTDDFYKKKPPVNNTVTIKYLFTYLKPYTKKLSIMFLLLLFGSLLTLILPFLTQNLIDNGINTKNVNNYFICSIISVFRSNRF